MKPKEVHAINREFGVEPGWDTSGRRWRGLERVFRDGVGEKGLRPGIDGVTKRPGTRRAAGHSSILGNTDAALRYFYCYVM
jgi:hypothetical protein